MAREDDGSVPRRNAPMNRDMTLDVVMDKAAAVEALAELYELLEEYAPVWYSEDLHHRAEAALRILRDQNE